MDIDISLVEDCTRLAKQCKMADLIEELQNKCKQVYEFGKTALLSYIYIFITCVCITSVMHTAFHYRSVLLNSLFLEFGLTFFAPPPTNDACLVLLFPFFSFLILKCPTSQESV